MAEAKSQFLANLPMELKEALEKAAVREDKSQNEIVILALEEYLKKKK